MSTTTDQDASAFRTWWRKRSFYAKNFLVLDAIALFVLMVALIASAASSNSSSDYSSSYPSSSSSSYSSGDAQAEYLYYVHSMTTGPYSDNTLLQLGRSACSAEAKGTENIWATNMVQSGTMDYSSANSVQTAATTYLCP